MGGGLLRGKKTKILEIAQNMIFFGELNNSKQKKIQKKILVKNFLSLGGGLLRGKKQKF